METEIIASVSGPGWKADVTSPGSMEYAIAYTTDEGKSLTVRFNPREDGHNVVADLQKWAEPAETAIPEEEKPELVRRLSQALDAYFVNDDWVLWTASWPRFPLAWKGPREFILDHTASEWLLYAEKDRAIVLPCQTTQPNAQSKVARVQMKKPDHPAWTHPQNTGPVAPADWQRIQARLETTAEIQLEWVSSAL